MGDRTLGPEMDLVLFAFVRTQSGREELINCEVKSVIRAGDLDTLVHLRIHLAWRLESPCALGRNWDN